MRALEPRAAQKRPERGLFGGQPAPEGGVAEAQRRGCLIHGPVPRRIGRQQPGEPLARPRPQQPPPDRVVEHQRGQLVQPRLPDRRARGRVGDRLRGVPQRRLERAGHRQRQPGSGAARRHGQRRGPHFDDERPVPAALRIGDVDGGQRRVGGHDEGVAGPADRRLVRAEPQLLAALEHDPDRGLLGQDIRDPLAAERAIGEETRPRADLAGAGHGSGRGRRDHRPQAVDERELGIGDRHAAESATPRARAQHPIERFGTRVARAGTTRLRPPR